MYQLETAPISTPTFEGSDWQIFFQRTAWFSERIGLLKYVIASSYFSLRVWDHSPFFQRD